MFLFLVGSFLRRQLVLYEKLNQELVCNGITSEISNIIEANKAFLENSQEDKEDLLMILQLQKMISKLPQMESLCSH